MIKGSFKRNDAGQIVSYELAGHAQAGAYGNDVVCAAVSALAISAVNGISVLAGFEPIIETAETEGGYLYVEVPFTMNPEQMSTAQVLLENLLLGLQATEQEYPKYIQIKTSIKQ